MVKKIGKVKARGRIKIEWNQFSKFNKKELRQETSRLAAIANKRIKRIQNNNLTDSPAYQGLVTDNGLPKFGVKGKDHNEVQRELSRLVRFLNSQTSTIRGIDANLKGMAETTKLKYKNLKDLRSKASKFFEIHSKVEQYLRTVEDMASAIGYQKIWEVINEYTEDQNIDLSESETAIDEIVERVSKLISKAPNETLIDDPLAGGDDWVILG